MKRTVNWKGLNLHRQCGVCKHYKPNIIDSVLTAHGNCKLSSVYKQRTETCMKYEKSLKE